MIVAGVMSGTSADGINVAIARCFGRGLHTRFEVLAHSEFPYPSAIRRMILSTMNARQASVADLARLNFLLGELYADAVLRAQRRARVDVELIGCHGQTLYHQGEPAPFLGRKLACTWQTGEGAVLAARTGIPVVSDFRPADMAAGGKGAPLVPFLDYLVYRHRRRGRIVQNIGGIANLTAIPARATLEQVIAFDTGPGNMVIDAVTNQLFGVPYDRDGRIAARGKVLESVLREALRHPFFRRKPPKTAGREQFGREFVTRFLRLRGRAPQEDMVATATALTARTIAGAVRRFVLPSSRRLHRGRLVRGTDPGHYRDYIATGGGARNKTLMRMIEAEIVPLGLRLRDPEDFGVPSVAKEAVAFAVLAYQTWRRRPGNIPAATGAQEPTILGKVSYV
ncbi:MAG: anhydro-N-acetylmuramic acid kinase [Acidobacteriia bacterium]|nr:anhydro-N-acetylmuramic acid kinase [Terriglobia bacterium]